MNLPGISREKAAEALGEMLSGALGAVSRFPLPSLAFLLLAVEVNLDIAGDGFFEGHDASLALFGAACAALAGNLLAEGRGWSRWTGHGIALTFASVAFLALFWHQPMRTLEWTVVAGLVGLVFVAPYLWRFDSRAFWLFGVRLSFAILLAGLALLLVAGGLSAIFASLTYLFGVEIPDRAYQHVWAATGLFVAPLFGLGQVPATFDERPAETPHDFMDRGVRSLGDYVAAPLLLIYGGILHAYALKIVITGDVPRGQIGWLVLCFGASIIGALIVVHPFIERGRAPTRFFGRFWPLLMPVPLILLTYAAWLRISAYGVTPDRYLLVLFGMVTAVLVALQAFARTRGDIRAMVALPALALLVAGTGPQGAVATSVRSQGERFESLVAQRPVDPERAGEAIGALRFLQSHRALEMVKPADLPETGQGEDGSLYRRIARAYGLNPELLVDREGALTFATGFAANAALPVDGFDLVVVGFSVVGNQNAQSSEVPMPAGPGLFMRLVDGELEVKRGETVHRFPVLQEDLRGLTAGESVDRPRLHLRLGTRDLMVVPTYIYGTAGETLQLQTLAGTLFMRAADWQ